MRSQSKSASLSAHRRSRVVRGAKVLRRRGVASVLSMMFLILFGSLVAAMAIASTGNIRTAATHLHVMRALSAAETGMAVAEQRLNEASSRFIVAESDLDPAFVTAIWDGDSGLVGNHRVTPPPSGHAEAGLPSGIAEALVNRHMADQNLIVGAEFISEPLIDAAPSGVPAGVYRSESWVYTPAIAVEPVVDGAGIPPAFQIRYAPLADGKTVRVIVDGFVFDYGRSGEPIRRTIQRDFEIVKRVGHAMIAPSRIMIGKNVAVFGDLGASFEDVGFNRGDPLIVRSDFYGMDDSLDAKLQAFWARTRTHDIDSDNRLRFDHPFESLGLPDASAFTPGTFKDVTGDGFLDEFDIFINHYDADGDGRVTLSAKLIEGTRAEVNGSAPEFVLGTGEGVDDSLGELIDQSHPDRNRNGVWGFIDDNDNGRWDPADGEQLRDYDDELGVFSDLELGYRDGYIDAMDQYAKVYGKLVFRAGAADWQASQGDYMTRLRGPFVPGPGVPPMTFEAADDVLPAVDATMFADTEVELKSRADGDPFWDQVASQLGVTVADLATWDSASNPSDPSDPSFIAVLDSNGDGVPENADAYFEKSPFNSPSFADWYYRPVFRNFVFRNVEIPLGLNALFDNCTFVGVTWVRTQESNSHPHWSIYGALSYDSVAGRPMPRFSRTSWSGDPADAPPMLPSSAVPPSQPLLIAASPLDKGDVLAPEIGSFAVDDYNKLPEPLVIDGRRVTDTKQHSNNLRFHDCLVVGSIVSDTPSVYTQVRNKMQFTGATRFFQEHPDLPDDGFYNPDPGDEPEIAKSTLLLPNYSVDIGSFNSPPEQDVNLRGAIIAGVLDVRGNASIFGALILTFSPEYGVAPLVDVLGNPIGNPAGFNSTVGYFGPDDGDYESLDPQGLTVYSGRRIVGWDLDADGLPDLPHDETTVPTGAVPVPFYGYGRIELRYDPAMSMPTGLMLPLSAEPMMATYAEGGV